MGMLRWLRPSATTPLPRPRCNVHPRNQRTALAHAEILFLGRYAEQHALVAHVPVKSLHIWNGEKPLALGYSCRRASLGAIIEVFRNSLSKASQIDP